MRLALVTGWDEEAIIEWPWPKLARWLAFYELEPFGPIQEDLRSGMECSLIYNSNRSKDAPAQGPGDFFHSLKPPEEISEEKDEAEQIWRMRIWVAMQKKSAG